eukprot:Sspe_Gene.23983::Locus_9405_Transcript_3_5_Confidence_0.737_Length_953::g.23983::m.23983
MPGRPMCWTKEHFGNVEKGLKCKFCSEVIGSSSGTQTRGHLLSCAKASDEVKARLEKEKGTPKKRAAASADINPKGGKITNLLGAVPKPQRGEEESIRMAWARYIFAAGVPFNHVAHPCFLEAINVTRPGIDAQAVMPSRHSLGTKYLDAVYEEVAAPMLADLDKAKYMTLQADGWKMGATNQTLSGRWAGDDYLVAVTSSLSPLNDHIPLGGRWDGHRKSSTVVNCMPPVTYGTVVVFYGIFCILWYFM